MTFVTLKWVFISSSSFPPFEYNDISFTKKESVCVCVNTWQELLHCHGLPTQNHLYLSARIRHLMPFRIYQFLLHLRLLYPFLFPLIVLFQLLVRHHCLKACLIQLYYPCLLPPQFHHVFNSLLLVIPCYALLFICSHS